MAGKEQASHREWPDGLIWYSLSVLCEAQDPVVANSSGCSYLLVSIIQGGNYWELSINSKQVGLCSERTLSWMLVVSVIEDSPVLRYTWVHDYSSPKSKNPKSQPQNNIPKLQRGSRLGPIVMLPTHIGSTFNYCCLPPSILWKALIIRLQC